MITRRTVEVEVTFRHSVPAIAWHDRIVAIYSCRSRREIPYADVICAGLYSLDRNEPLSEVEIMTYSKWPGPWWVDAYVAWQRVKQSRVVFTVWADSTETTLAATERSLELLDIRKVKKESRRGILGRRTVGYVGDTEMGHGKWILVAEVRGDGARYVFKFIDAVTGRVVRERGVDRSEFPNMELDKIAGGPLHGRVVGLHRWWGIGWIRVYGRPFDRVLAEMRRNVEEDKQPDVSFFPLEHDGSAMYALAKIDSNAEIVRITRGGEVATVASGLAPIDPPVLAYYDEMQDALVGVKVDAGGNRVHIYSYRPRHGSVAVTLSKMLPRYALRKDGSVAILAAGVLAGCEPEYNCALAPERPLTEWPPAAPSPVRPSPVYPPPVQPSPVRPPPGAPGVPSWAAPAAAGAAASALALYVALRLAAAKPRTGSPG